MSAGHHKVTRGNRTDTVRAVSGSNCTVPAVLKQWPLMLAVMEGRAITGRGGGQHIWNQSSRRWIDQYLDRTSLGSHQPIIPGIAGFHTCRLSQKCSGTFPAAVVMHECGEGLILREFQQHPSHDRRFHVE